jgi:hypothetical protein
MPPKQRLYERRRFTHQKIKTINPQARNSRRADRILLRKESSVIDLSRKRNGFKLKAKKKTEKI